jgi:hypothetical protein
MNGLQTSSRNDLDISPDAQKRRLDAVLRGFVCVSWSCRPLHAVPSFRFEQREEHWATIVCTTGDDAIRQSVRQRVVWLRVEFNPHHRARRRCGRWCSNWRHKGALLAVCGKPTTLPAKYGRGNWGVWMYLPESRPKRHRTFVRRSEKHFYGLAGSAAAPGALGTRIERRELHKGTPNQAAPGGATDYRAAWTAN